MRLQHYLTLPAIAALSWQVFDHLWPDLIPKIPKPIELPLAALAAGALLLSLGFQGWRWVIAKAPRPWFPRPFWRIAFWLRHRPSVTITTATPQPVFGDDVMQSCSLSLMVCRNLSNLPFDATLVFDNAEIVFTQIGEQPSRRRVFRPAEAASLPMDVARNVCDFIIMRYAADGLPAALPQAPNFAGDFRWELRGVRVLVKGPHPFSGEIVPSEFIWMRTFSSPNLPDVPSYAFDQNVLR